MMSMNKIIYAFISVLTLTSCAHSFTVQGTSNISTLDGRKLYLKVLKDSAFKNIDSCDIVHGQFHFTGVVDSIRMANLFMDDNSLLPLVLENGDITIKMDNTQQVVSGTPLNDKLFKFFNKYNQLKNQEYDLVHRHDQAIMNGMDMDAVNNRLNADAAAISQQEDTLITSFVTENFDNVLGPGVFFMVTIGYQYPELTPWIEDIMSKATDKFRNDPYVKDYYQKAQENQQIMNGMRDISGYQQVETGQMDNLSPDTTPMKSSPTPNELAKPISNDTGQ